jgi:hypothetical protein
MQCLTDNAYGIENQHDHVGMPIAALITAQCTAEHMPQTTSCMHAAKFDGQITFTTGQKTSPPHLHIPGKTPKVQRKHTPRAGRSLKVLGFICQGRVAKIKIASCSNFDGFAPQKQYSNDGGTLHTGLCANEYQDAAVECVVNPGKRRTRAATGQVVLVHDRDPSHSAAVEKTLASHNVTVLKMAARSPDLSPLDSGYWGIAKTKLRKKAVEEHLAWHERCKLFIEILKQTPHDKFIQEIPLRLQACIAANGWHIEDELKRIKREQRGAN